MIRCEPARGRELAEQFRTTVEWQHYRQGKCEALFFNHGLRLSYDQLYPPKALLVEAEREFWFSESKEDATRQRVCIPIDMFPALIAQMQFALDLAAQEVPE